MDGVQGDDYGKNVFFTPIVNLPLKLSMLGEIAMATSMEMFGKQLGLYDFDEYVLTHCSRFIECCVSQVEGTTEVMANEKYMQQMLATYSIFGIRRINAKRLALCGMIFGGRGSIFIKCNVPVASLLDAVAYV